MPFKMLGADARTPVDLGYVEADVRLTRSLIGTDYNVVVEMPEGVTRVEGRAVLSTFPHDDEEPDGLPKRKTVARLSALLVDLERTPDPIDALDELGGEAFEVAEAALLDVVAEAERDTASVGQVLIVENVLVEERYRGQRLGPRLLATVSEMVGAGGTTLVLLRAQPLQWETLSEADLRWAQRKVAASYESIGFRH